MPELDPITGNSPATLSVAQLAERLAMERALREQEYVAMRSALESIKELFTAQSVSDRRALQLQASEYERRLDDLNHAHAQAVEAAARTVPREMFEQYVKETSAREQALVTSQTEKTSVSLEAVNGRIDELVTWRSGVEGRLIGVTAVIGILIIIINVAIQVLS